MKLGLGLGFRGFSGGGASFSPLDIPDLALWLDASDASTITEAGGAVSQWDDLSGNANHEIQNVGSAQPTTGVATINGNNAIDFDGVNDYMVTSSRIINTPKPMTLIWAGKVNNPSPSSFSGRLFSERSGSGPILMTNSAGGIDFLWVGGGTNLEVRSNDNLLDTINPHVVMFRWDGSNAASNAQIYIDGVEVTYKTLVNGVALANSNGPGIGIGASAGGSTSTVIDAFFANAGIVLREITDNEANDLGSYLANRMGISWTNI